MRFWGAWILLSLFVSCCEVEVEVEVIMIEKGDSGEAAIGGAECSKVYQYY